MFVEQLIFVDVFSQLYYLTHAKKQPVGNHYHLEIQSSPDDSNIPSRKIAKSSSYRELEANNLK